MAALREGGQPVVGEFYRGDEVETQVRCLAFVVPRRCDELCFGLGVKRDRSYGSDDRAFSITRSAGTGSI